MEKEVWENRNERSIPQSPQESGIQVYTYQSWIVLVFSLAIKSQYISSEVIKSNILPLKRQFEVIIITFCFY